MIKNGEIEIENTGLMRCSNRSRKYQNSPKWRLFRRLIFPNRSKIKLFTGQEANNRRKYAFGRGRVAIYFSASRGLDKE